MQIRWFDVASGKDVQPPVDIAGPVQKIDFARGDVDATFVTRDASVRQWRHGDDSPLTLRKPQRSLFVAMSLTGRCLVVQRDDGASLEVLSLSGHSAARALLHPGGARQRGTAQPRTLAFASDGEALLSVDGRANAVGWNTSDAQLMNDNLWPRAALAAMAVGDNKLVAAMTDGSFAETTPDGRAVVEILKADVADVLSPLSNTGLLRWQAACISPDGSGAAWAETSAGPERECEVRVFFRDTNKVESYRWNRISCLAFDAARGTLILGLHNGTVRIVDVHGTRQKSFSWHLSHVTSLALSRDGNLLITGSSDGTIALWDPVHGTPLSDYMRLGKPVLGVTLSGDGKRFAVATDESFMVGDVATRALIGPRLSLPGFGGAIALNEDGTRVAVTDADGIVEACHIAPNSSAPPAWFHQLVSTYVARRFVGQGVLWTSDNPELGLIYQSIPNDASGPWNQFARWLLDHPGARAMSPWSTLSLGDYLEAVRARPGDVSQQEIRKYGPDVISIREGQSQ